MLQVNHFPLQVTRTTALTDWSALPRVGYVGNWVALWKVCEQNSVSSSGIPRIFFQGVGVQQIQLRIEGRENGYLGAVAPQSRVPLNLQMSETHILIRLLRMYFPRNREFGPTLSKVQNFRGGFEPPKPNPHQYTTGQQHSELIYLDIKLSDL
jgi:hypothetical protein